MIITKKSFKFTALIMLIILIGVINSKFSVSSLTVTACGVINESVALAQNIASASATDGCFDLNESNILFNCAGFSITGNPPGLVGFNITGKTQTLNNITILNCNLFNFTVGINATNVHRINITNLNFTNGTDGISFNNVSHSVINNASIGLNNTGRFGSAILLINVTNTTISFVAVPQYGNSIFANDFAIFNLLDSNKNYLSNNSVPSSGSNALSMTQSSNNTLVGNVFIATVTSGSGKDGAIIQASSQNNTFKYNNFSAARANAFNLAATSDNTTLIGNIGSTTNLASGSIFGILSAFNLLENNSALGIAGELIAIENENNTLINNTANMSGSGSTSAMRITAGRNLLINNRAYSIEGNGIDINGGKNNQFINNTCSSTSNAGAEITGTSTSNNSFTGNFCQSSANYGFSLLSAENYTFINNTFSGLIGFLLWSTNPTNTPGVRNTNFINTTVIGDTGFEINESTNNTITNTSFQNTNWSIKTNWNSNITLTDNQRITNYSFNNSIITISMTGLSKIQFFPFIIANGTNLSMDINLTNNKVHVNTTRTAGLNVSANITLFGQSKTTIQVAYDDINFVSCPATVCESPVLSGADTIFNVSHFTTFQGLISGDAIISLTKADNPDPITAPSNVNYAITVNNSGNLSAFNVTLTEAYPAGTTFVSAAPSPTTGNTVWNLGTITAGSQTIINVTISVPASISGNITNQINLSFNNGTGSFFVVNSTQNTIVNPSPPPAPSGASSGGGSRINFKPSQNQIFSERVELSKKSISLRLVRNQPTSEILQVTNKGKGIERIKLTIPKSIVKIDSLLITLLPGESKSLKLLITAQENNDDINEQIKVTSVDTNEEQTISLSIKIIKNQTLKEETKITPQKAQLSKEKIITEPFKEEPAKKEEPLKVSGTSKKRNGISAMAIIFKEKKITTITAILTMLLIGFIAAKSLVLRSMPKQNIFATIKNFQTIIKKQKIKFLPENSSIASNQKKNKTKK